MGAEWTVRASRSTFGPVERAQQHSGISVSVDTLLVEMSIPQRALPVLPELRLDLATPDVDEVVAAAAVIGDRTRAGILGILADGPHCVCEMAAALGERQNNVSMHLARLREKGLVRASRHLVDARWVYYERDEAACAATARTIGELLR
jgi:DNA-binding transcriptional ArsR family regulator